MAQGSVVVSQNIAVKVVNSTFFVSCYDPTNKTVAITWVGPHGRLGHRTRPTVQTASDGTRILFINTTLDDSGKYVCSSSENDRAEFWLTVEELYTKMTRRDSQFRKNLLYFPRFPSLEDMTASNTPSFRVLMATNVLCGTLARRTLLKPSLQFRDPPCEHLREAQSYSGHKIWVSSHQKLYHGSENGRCGRRIPH
ncbi:hypothetical protein HHI36_010494 [Cryptolaemus montrouzieri]|uniref:Ig-like domain-containing protein n=1 Tax=Cryptolaemus montrouzieri TaxID=559131 RepID=A0ABD2MIV4_9CUCU